MFQQYGYTNWQIAIKVRELVGKKTHYGMFNSDEELDEFTEALVVGLSQIIVEHTNKCFEDFKKELGLDSYSQMFKRR